MGFKTSPSVAGQKNAPGFGVHYFNATVFVDINVVHLINKKIVRFFFVMHT